MMQKKIQKFTLTELVIVVAVTAILAGMCIPVLNRTQDAVKTAACANNLKQIGIALASYAKNNDGYLPLFAQKDWKPPFLFQLLASENETGSLDSWRNYGKYKADGDYTGNDNKLFRCPSIAESPYGLTARQQYSDYAINQTHPKFKKDYPNDSGVFSTNMQKKLSFVRLPGQTLALIDGAAVKAHKSCNFVTCPICVKNSNTVFDPRHNDGSNILYFDGHVEWLSSGSIRENQILWGHDEAVAFVK